MIDLSGLLETPVGIEAPRIDAGEPWMATHVAGLQFYDYDQDDGLEGRVRPAVGGRLHLVRVPENAHDPNAVEVWWKNEHRLGHVPRHLARIVAPELDAGRPLRAYVWNGGDGSAWSMDMLLVGAAVAELHGQWLEREAQEAEYGLQRVEKRRRRESTGLVHADIIAQEQWNRRHERLTHAISVFSKMPWEPELPRVGETASAGRLGHLAGVSASTVHRIAARLGIPKKIASRGWYKRALPYELTPELREALADRCRRPRAIKRQAMGLSRDRCAA
ncbi:HIRAN domain-containing protein [Aureimonas psammosilenae]|uniref:HIRAN domain-containing protein n=1 Tax=Aureimonas psammosilenae TaxID=2495496 RepID=UPI0012611526|nr:HIRAN domain-containing protein [Aureimonas psammosilenae]